MILENLIIPYDYIIIIISAVFIIFSSWRGFIKSILNLLTWIGSIIITIYSYESLQNFISSQLSKFDILKNYESINNLIGLIISIPVIFLISLFIFKKIRTYIINDMDKNFIGLFFDKIFGFLYGIIFSYFIFATLLYGTEKFDILSSLMIWFTDNSYILENINYINNEFLKYFYNNQAN